MIKFNRTMVLLDFSLSMLYFAGKKGTLSETFFFYFITKINYTAQKMKKSLMENFIFCAVLEDNRNQLRRNFVENVYAEIHS